MCKTNVIHSNIHFEMTMTLGTKLLLVSYFFRHVTELGRLPSDSNVVGTVRRH